MRSKWSIRVVNIGKRRLESRITKRPRVGSRGGARFALSDGPIQLSQELRTEGEREKIKEVLTV